MFNYIEPARPSKKVEQFFASDLFDKPMLFDSNWIRDALGTIENLKLPEPNINYPPHNIVELEDGLLLEFALAGFGKDELKVYCKDGKLYISGQKTEDATEKKYVVKNIATRKFEVAYPLTVGNKKYEVVGNKLTDTGLLEVTLKHVKPVEDDVTYLPID